MKDRGERVIRLVREREARLLVDQIERPLRETKVLDGNEVITEVWVDRAGLMAIKVVKDEAKTEP